MSQILDQEKQRIVTEFAEEFGVDITGDNAFEVNFLRKSLDALHAAVVREIKIDSHDLPEKEQCVFITDHNPVWDGNYHTCLKCGKEFMTATQAKQRLLATLPNKDKE